MHDDYRGNNGRLTPNPRDLYDKEYFDKYGCDAIPYTRSEPRWSKFFGDVAEQIIRSLQPRTVLDVGCAIGFLVEEFWRRGVRAYGIDISEYAISQIPLDVRPFCHVLSATEPLPADFPQTYDLITCIEVLEHIPQEDAKAAIKNMTAKSDCILFSSTPSDLTEPTHVNVRPVIYWLQLFAEDGFYPDLRFDASFVSPQAFLLKKSKPRLEEDALPFFSESINRKCQINAQQEQIAALTRSNQELERRLGDELGKRDRDIESVRQEFARLNENHRELEESISQERVDRQSLREQLEALDKDGLRLRSEVQQLRETVGQKDTQIGHLSAEQGQLRRALADQETKLVEMRQRFEREVSERDNTIDALQVTHSGLLWDAFVYYRNAKDRCFPPRTKRRALYDDALQSLKMLMRRARLSRGFLLLAKHPVKTLKKLNKVNVNKFFYHVQHSDPAVLEAKLERKLGLDQPVPLPVATRLQQFALIISGCPGDAFRYRCEHQAEQLRFLGLTVDIAYFDQVDYRAALESYESYWLHRVPHTPAVEDFIRKAQELGKPVVFDTDDLIFDEGKIRYIRALSWMPQDEVDLYYDGVRRYHRTLSLCQFATVTTEPLREAIQELFPQIQCFINPNALSDAQLLQAEEALKVERPAADKEVVRIAYFSGTRTHNVDFQECSSALVHVLERYSNVRVMLVGHLDVGAEFEPFDDRVERHPLLPWQELPKLLRNVDINLAPLELDNPFTESKSALKYFEAAVMGVPTVASDVKAYRPFIRHGENGFLCRTEEDWLHCLARLVEDNALRSKMGNSSKTEVLEQVTTRKQSPRLRSIVTEILQTSPQSLKSHLSVAFVLRAPIAQVGGGYKNIFRLANYLADQGHDVDVYVEPIAHLEGKSDSEIVEFCHTYFEKSAAKIRVGHNAIKTCDIAIATNWPTAFVVNWLTNTLCKAYLIQDFEPDFYEYESPSYKEAATTYDLPLRKITLGRHLANMFEKEDKLPVAYIDFGIDHGIFYSEGRKAPGGEIKILFFARPALKRRGYETGIEALRQVYEKHAGVEISCYGMEKEEPLPFPYTHLGVLSPPQLAEAMRSAHIHLSFSLTNISFVPFEAMACGCAVVEAKVPSVELMVKDGENCLLADPQPDAVAEALHRMIGNHDLRERIAKAGSEFVHALNWDASCKQFETILFDSLAKTRELASDSSEVSANSMSPDHSVGPNEPGSTSLPIIGSRRGIFYRSCNFCGEKKFRVFKRLDTPFPDQIYANEKLSYPDVGKHLKLQYLECMNCGLVGINPLTRFADINRNSFDGERNIVAWADLDYAVYEADKLNTIKLIYDHYEFESYRRTNRLLDVSCGPGVSLKWLRDEKGWEVFGVDPDRHSVRMAWKKFKIRISNGLIHDLDTADEHFDVIIMDNSLEHMFDPLSILIRAFRLLRKGGGLFIFVPNADGLSTRLLNVNVHWGHWFLYSPKVLVGIVRRIGYAVTELSAIQNPINPELLARGIDIEPYRGALAVSLKGEENIAETIGSTSFKADYFNLMAVKPAESQIASLREAELAKIARSSIQERATIDIIAEPQFHEARGKAVSKQST